MSTSATHMSAGAASSSASSPVTTTETFRFEDQGYTAGCVVRESVLRDEDVVFAGMRVVEQPSEHLLIHVQTKPGGTTPRQALVRSVRQIKDQLENLQGAFQSALAAVRQ